MRRHRLVHDDDGKGIEQEYWEQEPPPLRSEVARVICGQGHVSNFYIVDLENFARASRRYTGDYTQLDRHRFVYDTCNTMKATRTRHGSVHVFVTRRPNQLHNFDLFRTCRISIVSALLRGNWQDFN